MIESMYELLERIGFSHPLHPPLTHLPIGLVMGAFIFIVVALLFRRPILPALAYRRIVLLAFIFSFPTILFGYTDWQHFYEGAWVFPIKVKLVLSGVLLILLYSAYRHGRHAEAETKKTLAIYTLCALTVVALGYLGGQLMLESEAKPQTTTSMRFLSGEKLFAVNCSECHPQGQDILKSPPLSDLDRFRALLRPPPDDMPPFPPEKLSDRQVKRLYRYIVDVLEKPGGK